MKHIDIRLNLKDDEWEIICDDKYLLATYLPEDVYKVFNVVNKDIPEKKMVEILFALELFQRIVENDDVDFVAKYMLTKLFDGVKIK